MKDEMKDEYGVVYINDIGTKYKVIDVDIYKFRFQCEVIPAIRGSKKTTKWFTAEKLYELKKVDER